MFCLKYLLNKTHRSLSVMWRLIVYLFPRNNRIVLYGGVFDLFIDNCKYLFLYNNEHEKNTHKHIWLTRNNEIINRLNLLGLKVVHSNSLYGKYLTLRAKYVFFDDAAFFFTNGNLLYGAVRIEMWHGIPLKMYCNAYMENQPPYEVINWFQDQILDDHLHGTHAISTTRRLDNINSATFGVPINRLIHASLPRTRILLMPESEREQFIYKYELPIMVNYYFNLKNTRLRKIIYMPTFRDKNTNYINEAIPNWNDLNDYCRRNNILFTIKVHRAAVTVNEKLSNIRVLDNMMDVYPLLPLYDILITDYSSIMYDFALMKKPILLYTYDIEDYMKYSRAIYNDFHILRKRMTEVTDYESLKQLMIASVDDIKQLPIEMYFDDPHDIDSINIFLKS